MFCDFCSETCDFAIYNLKTQRFFCDCDFFWCTKSMWWWRWWWLVGCRHCYHGNNVAAVVVVAIVVVTVVAVAAVVAVVAVITVVWDSCYRCAVVLAAVLSAGSIHHVMWSFLANIWPKNAQIYFSVWRPRTFKTSTFGITWCDNFQPNLRLEFAKSFHIRWRMLAAHSSCSSSSLCWCLGIPFLASSPPICWRVQKLSNRWEKWPKQLWAKPSNQH